MIRNSVNSNMLDVQIFFFQSSINSILHKPTEAGTVYLDW